MTVVGLLTGGATALAAPAATPAAAPAAPAQVPDYQPPPVQFAACANASLNAAGALCGFVTVPLDYANPAGQKIRIAISRVKHKTPDSQYQGVMLVNPGGPGGSGLGLSRLQSQVPNGAGNSYDWIGFDPRGVGSSEPRLSCDPGYAGYNRPHYVPDNARDEAAWINKATNYVAACAQKGRDLLPHLKTTDNVRDMDSIRKALAEPKINFYGFSYGTYLGTVYSTLFPQNVNKMVLDGVVDPTKVWEQANYDQDVAFEKSIKVFFGWVAKYDNVYHLGTTQAVVEQRYYEQYAKLRAQPAGGKIGSSEWNDIFLQAGYYVFGWQNIASAFSKWVNNSDASGLLALYPPPTDDNGYAIYLATQCSDAPWPDYRTFRGRNAALYPKAQFETWANAWFNAPCTLRWQAKSGTPVTVDGSKAPPILLVSETLDAATPYTGALTVRSLFPNSRLVEGVGGITHAGTLQNSTCENQAVAKYLTNGELPARRSGTVSDAQCDPNPQPVPSAVQGTMRALTGQGAEAAPTTGAGRAAPQRWSGADG